MNARILLPAALAAVSAAALGAAYIAQYGFGLQPCVLCLYQRIPFAVAIALGLLALVPGVPPRGRAALLALGGLALVVNAGIAGFHTGVEQHWWAGTEACAGAAGGEVDTVEDLMAAMSRPVEARCDQPPWSLFGITMAMMNVPFSLALAAFALWSAARLRRERG
jgi:disulfide bond formation protein DsbB